MTHSMTIRNWELLVDCGDITINALMDVTQKVRLGEYGVTSPSDSLLQDLFILLFEVKLFIQGNIQMFFQVKTNCFCNVNIMTNRMFSSGTFQVRLKSFLRRALVVVTQLDVITEPSSGGNLYTKEFTELLPLLCFYSFCKLHRNVPEWKTWAEVKEKQTHVNLITAVCTNNSWTQTWRHMFTTRRFVPKKSKNDRND